MDQATIDEVAVKAAHRYQARVWWADPGDLRQEARVAVLAASRTWDASTGVPFAAYAWRACMFHLRRWCWKNSAPVTEVDRKLPDLAGVHAIGLAGVMKLDEGHPEGTPPGSAFEPATVFPRQLISSDPGPDEALIEAERRAAIRREAGCVLEPLGLQAKAAYGVLTGEDAPRGGPGRKTAAPPGLARARALLRRDAALFRLYREGQS